MKTTIWKYELKVTDIQTINLPANSTILSLQIQDGKPYIWVMVNLDEEDSKDIVFTTKGTGHIFEYDNETFIGTYQLDNGCLIFHVFIKL